MYSEEARKEMSSNQEVIEILWRLIVSLNGLTAVVLLTILFALTKRLVILGMFWIVVGCIRGLIQLWRR